MPKKKNVCYELLVKKNSKSISTPHLNIKPHLNISKSDLANGSRSSDDFEELS